MGKTKVSVIIPVYGVEKYIEKCARSLFEQTLDDIEFIFVDDCTPDNSITILERVLEDYPERLPKTKIIHHEVNKGLPITRQTGLAVANGDYIAHCDSDDWIDVNMYQEMLSEGEKTNADIVICDSYMVAGDNLILRKGCAEGISAKEAFRNMVLQKMPWTVWNKIIKRELYKKTDYVFPTKTHSEDMVFSLQLFYYASKIAYIQKAFYFYVTNSSIPTHKVNDQLYLKRFNESLENVKCVEYFIKDKPEKNLKDYLIYLKLIQRDNLLPIISQKKYYDLWKNTYPEINSQILFNRTISFKHKLKYFMIRCHLGWFFVKMGRID